MDWQEFSFEPKGGNGQSQHVYSRDEAESLIAGGMIEPKTPVTVFFDDGRRKATTADALGIAFPGAAPASGTTPPPPPPSAPKSVPATTRAPAAGVLPSTSSSAYDQKSSPTPTHGPALAPAPAPAPKLTPVPTPPARPRPAASPLSAKQAGFIGLALLAVLAIIFIWTQPEQRWTVVETPVYSQADTDSALVATLPPGTLVKVAALDDTLWFRIAQGDYQDSFILSANLTDVEPAAEAALTEAVPAAEAALTEAPVEDATPVDSLATPESTETAARPDPAAERRAIPPACREWTARARIDLCIAVQGRFAELRTAYAGSSIGGEQPEQTLRSAIIGCSTRRCVDQRLGARISDLSQVVVPRATLTPAAVDRSRPASPRGNESRWVTQDDYPSAAIRRGSVGTTGVSLIIGTNGRVSNCDIVQSSGDTDLDAAACRAMTRRARFEPALDNNGNPVEAVFTKRIRWQLPEE